MPKVKLVLGGFALAAAIAGIVIVYSIVQGNKVKNDVADLEGWAPSKGQSLQNLKKKKSGQVGLVVKYGESAVPHLLEALQTWEPADAVGVIMALGFMEVPEALPTLVEILKKEEGKAGVAAAAALGNYEEKASSALEELAGDLSGLPPSVRLHAYQAMAWTGDDGLLEAIANGLSDEDESVAVAVAEMTARREGKVLAEPLLKALRSERPAVSDAAVQGLVRNKTFIDIEDVEPLLASDKIHVQANAVTLMGYLDRILASRKVRPFLEKDDPRLAVAAAEALLRMDEVLDGTKIVHVLEHKDPELVRRTAMVLKRLNKGEPRDKFIEMLKSDSAHTRNAAAELIALSATSEPGAFLEDPAVPALIELLKDPETVEAAARTLHLMTREHALDEGYGEWKAWWEEYKKLYSRLNEARAIYKKIKAWKDEDELRDRPREALDLIHKARSLYDEIEEKGLSRRGYDNEVRRLIMLERAARTYLMN